MTHVDHNFRQIEGRNPAIEALKADTEIFEVLLEKNLRSDGKISAIKSYASRKEIPVRIVPRKYLEQFSKTGVHQGVILKAAPLAVYSLPYILKQCEKEGRSAFILLFTELMYQYNLGAIVRSAAAAGVDAVVLPRKTKEPGAIASRASMGALEHMPIVYENIFVAIKTLQENGVKTVAADSSGSKKYYDCNMRLPLAILIGGEDRGISDNLLSRVDEVANIPCSPKVNSLNLSVAAALMLFETIRQNDV